MKDNKLIAEFMGYKVTNGKCYSPKYKDGTIAPMQFDRSWDWLMPVISKIETVSRGWFPHELHNSLMKNDIEYAYKAVVEFIKGWPHAPYTDLEGNTYI